MKPTKFGRNLERIQFTDHNGKNVIAAYNPFGKYWYNVNTKEKYPNNYETWDGYKLNGDFASVANQKNSNGVIRQNMSRQRTSPKFQYIKVNQNPLFSNYGQLPYTENQQINNLENVQQNNINSKNIQKNNINSENIQKNNINSKNVQSNVNSNIVNNVKTVLVKPNKSNTTNNIKSNKYYTTNQYKKEASDWGAQSREDVIRLQKELRKVKPDIKVDGIWGPETSRALRFYQYMENPSPVSVQNINKTASPVPVQNFHEAVKQIVSPRIDLNKISEKYPLSVVDFAKLGRKLVSKDIVNRFKNRY